MEGTLTAKLLMKTHKRPLGPKPQGPPTRTVEVEEGQGHICHHSSLSPTRKGESSDVPPTPGPSPPGTMKKWPTQDLSKIVVDREEPTPTEENVDTCTSTQREQQEKQD